MAVFILAANIIDAGLTYVGSNKGFVTEANPIMAYFLYGHVTLFFLLKMLLPLLLLVIYWKWKTRFVRRLMYVTVAVYSYVLILHMYWIFKVLVV